MKMILGEYGKIIILAIILCVILNFWFSRDEDGFISLISQAKPSQSFGKQDSFGLAESILLRKAPELMVEVKKLQKGSTVNLLDREMFQITAINEDKESVNLNIEKIIDAEGNDITTTVNSKSFTPMLSGKYFVTYKAEENFKGSKKVTEKEYCFVAD